MSGAGEACPKGHLASAPSLCVPLIFGFLKIKICAMSALPACLCTVCVLEGARKVVRYFETGVTNAIEPQVDSGNRPGVFYKSSKGC